MCAILFLSPADACASETRMRNRQCDFLFMSVGMATQGMRRHIFLRWWVRTKDAIRLRRLGWLHVYFCAGISDGSMCVCARAQIGALQ